MTFFGNLFRSRRDEVVVLIDIGSDSIAGSYVRHGTDTVSELIYSRRLPIELQEGEPHERAMLRALDVLSAALVTEGLPALARARVDAPVTSILVSVDAPWQQVKVQVERIEQSSGLTFTKRLVDEMLSKARLTEVDEGKTITNASVIATVLNGYPVQSAFGKKVRSVAVVVLVSLIDRAVSEAIHSKLRDVLKTQEIQLLSGSSLRYQAMRIAFPHEQDALIVDAAGSEIEIVLIRKGLLVSVSEIERNVTATHKDDDYFLRGLGEIAKSYPLPRTIFLLARESEIGVFKKKLESTDFGALWFSGNSPTVLPVLASHISGLVKQGITADSDIPLLFMALYLSASSRLEKDVIHTGPKYRPRKNCYTQPMPTHRFDDIIPPSRRREAEPLSEPSAREVRPSRRAGGSRFPYATMLVVVAVVGISAGSLYFFSSATIEVEPRVASATVQGSFTATQSSGELPFVVITAQKVASQPVKSSGTKTVSTSASGPIVIYNTQSKPQALVANTRFSTPAGLIFRIKAPVSVPAGSVSKPGSITVTVYADQAGSQYNVPASSFTIPGFAGKPQATQVYARSSVAMSGGASGVVPVVDAATAVSARHDLISALDSDIAGSIQGKIPSGYVLLSGAATTTYQELDSTPSSTDGMVDLKVQGTITAVVFPNTALAKAIASSVPGLNYQGEPISLASSTNLQLTPSASLPSPESPSFTFDLSGVAPLTYTVEKSRIAAAVAGKTRSAAEVALTSYPEIGGAVLVLRPFWKQAFPEDPASIKIIVKNP